MLEISTNNLGTRKKAKIDGHIYTVRKFSNLEQLDVSQYRRRLEQLVQLYKEKEPTPEHSKEAEDIGRNLFDIYVRLFDDGEDQSLSRALLGSMTYDEIAQVLLTIFDVETHEKALDEA